jgi:hypothetical protein
MSFLIATLNAGKLVMARALGEEEMVALSRRIILATPPWPGLLFLVLPGLFVGVLAVFLVLYSEQWEWSYFFGFGMLNCALAVLLFYPIHYFRVRREATKAS